MRTGTHYHRRHVRKLLRRGVIAVFLLSAIAATVAFHVTRPERIASFAGQMIERLTGAEVHIESASFSLNGTIMLHGLELRVPGLEGEGGRLFEADTALLKIDPAEAVRGRFVAGEMLLLRPTLSLTEIEEQRFNYEQLRLERAAPLETADVPALPHIYLRDGRVRYGEVHDGSYRTVGSLHVAGRLDPDREQAGLYHFELAPQPEDYAGQLSRSTDPSAGPLAAVVHPTLRGRFDLEQLDVHAELADFAFVDPHRNMLPRQIRRWWDLFEPSGSLRNIRFDYDAVTGPTATVDVEGVSLSLPQLSDVDYDARMSDVSGTFHFDSDQIRVSNLVGQIEGLQYRINGIIDGYSTESAFHLSVETLPFQIPEQPRFMPAMPLDVQEVFKRLTPVGWTRVSLVLRRDDAGGAIAYNGSADILSGRELVAELMRDPRWRRSEETLDPNDPRFSSRAEYSDYPYPLRDVTGRIAFNSDRIRIKHLTGNTSGGGRVSVTGVIAPPSADAHLDLTIEGTNIPFDETLRNALHEPQQRIIDRFFHRPSDARLRGLGHYASSADRAAAQQRRSELRRLIRSIDDQAPHREALEAELAYTEALLDRPVFDLGGRMDVTVHLNRKLDNGGGAAGVKAVIRLDGMSAVYEKFPYPVTVTGGEVVVTDEGLDFRGVRGRALTGGRLILQGNVATPRDASGSRVVPDLALKAEALPVDAVLTDAIPRPHNQWLQQLNAEGMFAVEGRIMHDPKATTTPPIGFDLGISFTEGTLAPGEGRYPLRDVEGELRLTLRELTIERLHARHDEAELELAGAALIGGESAGRLELSGRGSNMHLQDHVLDLLIPAVGHRDAVQSFWDRRRPSGRFDVDFQYHAESGAQPGYRLQLHPHTLSFDHQDHRVMLGDVAGAVVVEPGHVVLEDLAARLDEDHDFLIDGRVALRDAPAGRVALTFRGDGISPTLRRLAPAAIGDLLEDAGFAGRYTLNAPHLELAVGDNGEPRASGRATLDLEDASFDLGLPVTGFHGTAALDIAHNGEHHWPEFELGLNASRLQAAGRTIRNLSLAMQHAAGDELVRIPQLTAKLAGGAVTGRGGVDLDRGRYQLDLALADARLQKLVNSTPAPAIDVAGESPAGSGYTADRTRRAAEDGSFGHQPVSASRRIPAPPRRSADEIDGLVSLSLALEGGWKADRAVRGRGDLDVRDANLGGLPLAMGLLRMTHLTLPADQRFERGVSSYYVQGDRIVFERLQLDAPGMRIGGSGSLDYRTRDLDITLTTSNPEGLDLGPITTLIDGLRDQLITLRITGTTDEPRLQVRQLDGLTEALDQIFRD